MSKRSLTLCIPSSCISSPACNSLQQATHVAHQIARAAVLYQVDEIVVYDDVQHQQLSHEQPDQQTQSDEPKKKKIVFGDDDDVDMDSEKGSETRKNSSSVNSLSTVSPVTLLAHLLQFFITPSYLRSILFAPDDLRLLQYAKKIPKIPGLPFLSHAKARYLEGVTVRTKIDKKLLTRFKKGSTKSKKQLILESTTDKVQIGADQVLSLADNQRVPLGARVTVDTQKKKVVTARAAYASDNFGYSVRVAASFGKVFTESPYEDGYSYTVYVPCEDYVPKNGSMMPLSAGLSASAKSISPVSAQNVLNQVQTAKTTKPHYLFVFGKWSNLESTIKSDTVDLTGVDEPKALFDGRLTLKACGRVEDAVLISLARLDV